VIGCVAQHLGERGVALRGYAAQSLLLRTLEQDVSVYQAVHARPYEQLDKILFNCS
jgi:hypothetical protein